MRKFVLVPILLTSLAGFSASAQVSGGQASPEELKRVSAEAEQQDVEVKPPLLVQVSLATKPGGVPLPKRPFDSIQTFNGTRQYVCDKARVEYVTVIKHKASKGRVRLLIATKISTGWFAQRVDLTLGLYDGDRQIKSQTWDRLRIGHENAASAIGVIGSSSSKAKDLEVELSQDDLDGLFAEGHLPTVKVLVAIHDD